MIKYLFDTHTHTIASGHAFSTIQEVVEQSREIGHKMVCITDHGILSPGAFSIYYFNNLLDVPAQLKGIEVLKGVEANIVDIEGNVDMPDNILGKLDIVLAGFHKPCFRPINKKVHTELLLKLIKSKRVNIITHCVDPEYDMDYETIAAAAKENNIILEVNNKALSPSNSKHQRYRENYSRLLELCKKHKVYISLGSDAHISTDVGTFEYAEEVISEGDYPEELIVNTSVELLKDLINRNKFSKKE